MNKNLLNPIFTALAVCILSSSSLSGKPVAPVRTMVIPSWGAVAIDGTADYGYGEMQTTHIFNPTGLEGDADFSVSFSVCWNSTYLYLYAEITDDVDESYTWGVGNPWEFDNLEIFLQLDTNTLTTSYGPTTVQLRICRGLDSVESPGHAKRSDFIYYMEDPAPGGWLCEVAVPWTAVLASGSDPEDIMEYACEAAIGFDFSGADSDNTDGDPAVGNRDVQSAWDDDDPSDATDRTEDNAWNNTSVFGYVDWNFCGGLVNGNAEGSGTILPNPAASTIQIPDIINTCSLAIYTMQGAAVLITTYHPGQELDISSLQSGLYMAVIDGNESVKFIKD